MPQLDQQSAHYDIAGIHQLKQHQYTTNMLSLGNVIHDFTAVTHSVKSDFIREKRSLPLNGIKSVIFRKF